jgi:hypothetical protein
MANPFSQVSQQYVNRYTNTQRAHFQRFDAGMARDIQSFELPEGYCYDAQNLLCDYVGKIRKRGGTTVPQATNRTAVINRISGFKSGSLDALTGLVGTLGNASGANAYSISRTTGAATSLALGVGTPSLMAKPFQHRSYMVIPVQNTDGSSGSTNDVFFWGGSTAAGQGGTGGTTAIGSNTVTGLTSGTLTSANVGQFLVISRPGTPQYYAGRIISASGTTAVVEPTPQVVVTGTAWSAANTRQVGTFLSGIAPVPVGKYAISYQGRIVQANTAIQSSGGNSIEYTPTRVAWSKLQSEITGSQYDGDQVLFPFALAQQYNYVDFPSALAASPASPPPARTS